jgi:hypothetical protein
LVRRQKDKQRRKIEGERDEVVRKRVAKLVSSGRTENGKKEKRFGEERRRREQEVERRRRGEAARFWARSAAAVRGREWSEKNNWREAERTRDLLRAREEGWRVKRAEKEQQTREQRIRGEEELESAVRKAVGFREDRVGDQRLRGR